MHLKIFYWMILLRILVILIIENTLQNQTDGLYDYLRTPIFLAPKYELLNDSLVKQLIDESHD